MALIETTATELHQLVQAHPKVLAMFNANHCAACEHLRPIFALFATNQAYTEIAFLYVTAAPALNATAQPDAPVFASYCRGHVLHHAALHTEHQLRAALHALHAHM